MCTYDYVRSVVDDMFVDARWNSGHVHGSFSISPLKENALSNLLHGHFVDAFCKCQNDVST